MTAALLKPSRDVAATQVMVSYPPSDDGGPIEAMGDRIGNPLKVQPNERHNRVAFDELFQRLDRPPKRKQPPLLLFFDEFQALLELEQQNRYDFLGRLRKGIQHLKHVRVAFAGSVRHALHDIFQNPESPFYNAAEPIDVGPITPPERFHQFLEKKFRAGKRTPTGSFWSEVATISGGNPSDTQRLCAAVWETSRAPCKLTKRNIDRALERIFEHEHLMNISIIEQSTALQKKCLVAVAEHGGENPTSAAFLKQIGNKSSASALKALGAYVKRGILYKSGPAYRFLNPFLREWIVRHEP